MRLCFAAVGEVSPEYLNMIIMLLYSFRKNAGIYKNAPFTVVTNGVEPPKKYLSMIQENFAPIQVIAMPRLGGTPHNNKFNAFYAVDESTYDVLVLIDCDTVILGALDDIAENCNFKPRYFKAVDVGKIGAESIKNYEFLVQYYCNITKDKLQLYKTPKFQTEYPLFNSGVIVLSKEVVRTIRDDAIQIAYDLYQKRQLGGIGNKDFTSFETWIFNSRYPLWITDQMGLALALIKHKIPYEILERKFNWTNQDFLSDGSAPSIFHYMKGLYTIDRANLFNGDWIEEYLNSDSATKQALATLVVDIRQDLDLSKKFRLVN